MHELVARAEHRPAGAAVVSASSSSRRRALALAGPTIVKTAAPGVDEESLLRIAPIARALGDRRMRPVDRAVDARWRYADYVPTASLGCRPFAGELFYAARSSFAGWRVNLQSSARDFNMADRLVTEALVYARDHLRAWAYGLLRALHPEAGLGFCRVTEDNFEELVFLHLLAETVASVGVDYWYLSTVSINKLCPVGTRVGTLSVDYHEADLDEYRRAHPDLVVQHKAFFFDVAQFYCSGVFRGFSARDLVRSPMTQAWVSKELRHGAQQRRQIREWLGFMGGVAVSEADAEGPTESANGWQRKLTREAGTRLWALVKEGVDSEIKSIDPGSAWRAPPDAFDPRFTNVSHLEDDNEWVLRCTPMAPERRRLAMEQALLRVDYEQFDHDKGPRLRDALRDADLDSFQKLTAAEPRVPRAGDEPRDLCALP